MSIITDVKNILKGVGIVSPQKGAQETGAPFVSPQPQIFKPIQQTPAPFVPILSPIQAPIASPLVKTNNTPYIYNPSLSPEKNIQAESRMRESQGLANPNTPLANIPFESRMRESQWLPQSTISAVPASPTPWLKIAQDSIGGLWEYIAPESADSYSEDIDNRTKYLERVEEREWNGIRAGWAKVLDFLASQSPALQLFNKIEDIYSPDANRDRTVSWVVKNIAEDRVNKYEDKSPDIKATTERHAQKIVWTINNVIGTAFSPFYESKNGIQIKNAAQSIGKVTSELQNKWLPLWAQAYAQADLERARGNIQRAEQLEKYADTNTRVIAENAAKLLLISSKIQDDENVNTPTAQARLYAEVAKWWNNINSFMMQGMVGLDGEPVDRSLAEAGTRYDFLLNNSSDIWFGNTRDRIYADAGGAIDYLWFVMWATNKVFRQPAQKAARDLWTTPDNMLELVRSSLGSSKATTNPLFSWEYGEIYGSADSLRASDLWFLWGMSLSTQEPGLLDISNQYMTNLSDKIPEFVVALSTMWFNKLWQLDSIPKGIKATKWLNTVFTMWKNGMYYNTMWKLWLRVLADTTQTAVIESFMQWNYNNSNIVANVLWFAVWDIYELTSSYKQVKWVSNLWKATKEQAAQWLTDIEDLSWYIRDAAQATKKQEFVEWGMDVVEAGKKAKWLSDEELVGTKIDVNYIDNRIKQVDQVLAIKKQIWDNYQDTIAQQKALREIETDETKALEIDNNIRLLQWAQSTFNRSFDSAIAMANASRKFNANPTVEGALEYAQTLKLFLPTTENPNAVLRSLTNLPDNISSIAKEWLWDIGKWKSMVKYTDWWAKYRQAVDAWFSPEKIYDSKWIDEVIANAKEKESIRWIAETNEDWTLKYFNKTGWEYYMLNTEWFAKMNIEEKSDYVRIYREMWTEASWQEKFLETMRGVDETSDLKIPDEDLQKIEDWNLYETLLDEIDDFIPCVI